MATPIAPTRVFTLSEEGRIYGDVIVQDAADCISVVTNIYVELDGATHAAQASRIVFGRLRPRHRGLTRKSYRRVRPVGASGKGEDDN